MSPHDHRRDRAPHPLESGFGVRRSYAGAWCAGPLRSGPAPVIDLHCHILPGIDDGAADAADSVAMAAQAQDDGIELVCATPHIRWDHDVRIPELAGRVAALNEKLASQRIRTRVATGGEVAETSASISTPPSSRRSRSAAVAGGSCSSRARAHLRIRSPRSSIT